MEPRNMFFIQTQEGFRLALRKNLRFLTNQDHGIFSEDGRAGGLAAQMGKRTDHSQRAMRIEVQSQPGQIIRQTLSREYLEE
jgi:hypothetical protein